MVHRGTKPSLNTCYIHKLKFVFVLHSYIPVYSKKSGKSLTNI